MPAVDRLEKEYTGSLQVIRLDIQSNNGRQLARAYGARLTPTFILLDSAGNETWRSVGNLDAEHLKDLIRK